MASIIENLITELNDEYALYEQLLQVSMEKTSAIVSNNLDRLSETTEKEQRLADALASVEHRRRETMTNVANILGKRPDDVKVMDVVTFLEGQPEFHDPLLAINEKLAKRARKVREVLIRPSPGSRRSMISPQVINFWPLGSLPRMGL